MVPDEVVDAAAVDGEGLVEQRGNHARVLDAPGRPAASQGRIPADPVVRLAAVPDNEIASIPTHPRIGVLVESDILFRPSAHVQAVKDAEAGEPERVEVDVCTVTVGRTLANEAFDNLHGGLH